MNLTLFSNKGPVIIGRGKGVLLIDINLFELDVVSKTYNLTSASYLDIFNLDKHSVISIFTSRGGELLHVEHSIPM